MGEIMRTVEFSQAPPSLDGIVREIERITGLGVHVELSGDDVKEDLYDLHARIAFKWLRGHGIVIYTRRAQRLSDAVGGCTVHLKGYSGQELSIMFAAVMAMEALGGTSNKPVPEDVRKRFSRPPTFWRRVMAVVRLRMFGIALAAVGVMVVVIMLPMLMFWCIQAAVRKGRNPPKRGG